MTESLVDLTSQLIRTHTTRHSEAKAIRLLAPILAHAGFGVETVP